MLQDIICSNQYKALDTLIIFLTADTVNQLLPHLRHPLHLTGMKIKIILRKMHLKALGNSTQHMQ